MKKCMIIVAGGNGSRMGSSVPKQFLLLGNRPLLMHTLQNLSDMDCKMNLILVLPERQQQTWANLCDRHNFRIPHKTISGGDTRFQSVQNGLSVVTDEKLIGVHDGVRPFAPSTMVQACFAAAQEHGGAIPVTPVIQSLRKIEADTNLAVDRNDYRAVQTPQCFRADILKKAYLLAAHDQYSDDASVVEATGQAIHLVQGHEDNIKITTPADLDLAQLILGRRSV